MYSLLYIGVVLHVFGVIQSYNYTRSKRCM